MKISFPKVTFFTTFANSVSAYVTDYLETKNPVSPEPVKRPVASCELSTYYIVL